MSPTTIRRGFGARQEINGGDELCRRRIEPDGSTRAWAMPIKPSIMHTGLWNRGIVSAARVGAESSGGRFQLRTNKNNNWRKTPKCVPVELSTGVRSESDDNGTLKSRQQNQGLHSTLSLPGESW